MRFNKNETRGEKNLSVLKNSKGYWKEEESAKTTENDLLGRRKKNKESSVRKAKREYVSRSPWSIMLNVADTWSKVTISNHLLSCLLYVGQQCEVDTEMYNA